MIRLAIIGAKDSRWRELAPRLRGVILDAVAADASSPACDAAVFFELALGEIDRYLQAGKPVLVAAQRGLTKVTLQTLSVLAHQASVARQACVNLVVANPDRYLPSRQLIRQQLHAGKLGDPGLIRIHHWEPAAQEGSLLRDLDLVLWYFRAMPRVVYTVAHPRGTQIHLGFPAGGIALVGHANLPAGDSYSSLSVIGASGAAYADDHANLQLVYQGGPPRAFRTGEGVGQWSLLVQEFADAIRAGRDARSEHPHWSEAILTAEAVEKSLRTKQAVVLEGVP
jgi:predicted dehydrogenase